MIIDALKVVEIPEGLSKALERAAQQAGVSVEEYIVRAIARDVETAVLDKDEQ